jgi:2',3'-cyclic-nucleotide 2'-phosphodiesterase/3'-nucleotidase
MIAPVLFATGTREFSGPVNLTILGTTDIHSNVWGFSYENDKESTNNGMARIATYIDEVRSEEPYVILVDNGDTVQGSIMTDDLYNKREGVHPVISAMNYLKYDSMTLGNHEYNFGEDLIKRLQTLADFPILGGNLSRVDGTMAALPYTIIQRGGLKIGIIGMTNPNAPRWDGEKVDSFTFAPVGPATQKIVEIIKDKVDVIIVVAHVGLYPEYDEDFGSDSGMKILEMNPDIDVLLLGHAHITLQEKMGDTVVGSARNLGREVVRFDLTIGMDKKVISSSVEVIDMADYQPSEALRSLPIIATSHQATRDFISGGAPGEDGKPSGGIFGQASVDFQPENEIMGIPEGKLRDTAVMDLINKVQLMNSGADVSAAALFSDSSNIPQGDINYGTIFGIYKYDNTLYRVPITGRELKKYMEWSAACYNQWKPGDLSISFNPEKPGYLYDMFAGVDYEIDLSKPEGSRIKNVMFKGKPLQDNQELTIAVNNYRYSSALKAQKLVEGKREWESPNSIRDMLVDYIKEQKVISPSVDNNWKIVGVNLNSPYREKVIKMVNDGTLEVPYAQALNINTLMKEGVIK